MTQRRYITTAIDFPNAAPHMGHVYEKILADVIARWFRLKGEEVRFHLGTDENGIKIQQTAKAAGISPRQLVDQNAPKFEQLFRRLNISFDYFIRTADSKKHWPTVEELWKRLQAANFLEKRTYTGLYCAGCERFVTAKDLVDGVCPDHQVAPQTVTEDNWFFLLKKKQGDIRALLDPETGTYRIVPLWRGNETYTFLEGGLEDVSFSRSTKTLTWGVPVPGDPDQVMYVWCDNLTSYISSLGFFTNHEMREWWDDADVTHVIGKDIARFHAINWPAMLQVADVRTPDRLLIHGFLTSDGQKMSKSIGNVVVPDDVLEKYGVDPLRFYLMHEIPVGNDGDFSWKRFGELYDAKLRNQLGNLLNRVLVLLAKDGGSLSIPNSSDDAKRIKELWPRYTASMDAYAFHEGIQEAMQLVDALNGAIDRSKPWTLKGTERQECLSGLAESLRHVSLLLLPFLPATAQTIATQLGVPYASSLPEPSFTITPTLAAWAGVSKWKSIGVPSVLFPPIEV